MSYFKIALLIFLFVSESSLIQAQSIVTKEYHDNRFTPQEIGLPDNMPYVKSVIWGEEGIFRKLDIGPDTRVEELQLRRKMLKHHQWIGILTLAGLAYQYDVGKKLFSYVLF